MILRFLALQSSKLGPMVGRQRQKVKMEIYGKYLKEKRIFSSKNSSAGLLSANIRYANSQSVISRNKNFGLSKP